MNKDLLSNLLDKYINGTCTPEEMEVIDKWYNHYQHGQEYIGTLSDGEKELLKAKMFNAISERTLISKPKKAAPVYRQLFLRIAAAAMLVIFIKLVFFHNPDKPVLSTGPSGLNVFVKNSTRNILKQVLPDNSVVWLGPEASVSWPKKFKENSREINMNGSCFFEVTKNPACPFIITSTHIVTKVWGTSFRIVDSKEVGTATVTVITGKVSVSKKAGNLPNPVLQLTSGEIMLFPKGQAILKNNANLIENKNADVSDLTLYKHLDISFDNAKLTEIVSVLNEKFDVNIKIQDKQLDEASMTADLTGLNLPEVLKVLKASMKIDYEVNKDLIILKKTN